MYEALFNSTLREGERVELPYIFHRYDCLSERGRSTNCQVSVFALPNKMMSNLKHSILFTQFVHLNV